jgi:3-dehydroquinate synthetase
LAVTPQAVVERVTALLKRLRLPVDLSAEPLGAAADLLGLDKKRRGRRVKFVLVREPGQIEYRQLELTDLARLATDLARAN